MAGVHGADLSFLLLAVVYSGTESGYINTRVKTITSAHFLLKEVKTGYSGFSHEPTESPRRAHAQPTLSPRTAYISIK